jgi:hypothetical protein
MAFKGIDSLDYHEVVKIVEKFRSHSVKMIQTDEMRILEPVLNKIRFELRELRKALKVERKNQPEKSYFDTEKFVNN